MSKTVLSVLAVALAVTCGSLGAAQGPYQLLYSAPNPSSQGAAPIGLLEASPGLFYFLSSIGGQGPPAFGPSVFSLEVIKGAPTTLIYSLPSNVESHALVQESDGSLLLPGAIPLGSRYYTSIGLNGQNAVQYSSGNWGSFGEFTVVAGKVYDEIGKGDVSGLTTVGFMQVGETGKLKLLYQQPSSNGTPGPTKMVLATDGNLYGLGCQGSGQNPPCYLYRLTPSGEYTQFVAFPATYDGAYGYSLVAATDGYLYGTFSQSGANNTGFIYRATLAGQYEIVASFPAKGTDDGMYYPNSLMEASDGALYGSTVNNSIFRYDLKTQALTLAYQMNRYNFQGGCAPCQFLQGMDGKLYSAAETGGPGGGAVFSLNFGLPPPPPKLGALVPSSGAVGQQVLLFGSYLLGATSVTFNGIEASAVQVNSAQAVVATVPVGASTGPVTITTANGSVTAKLSFTVQ
jgi:hypothetical protein